MANHGCLLESKGLPALRGLSGQERKAAVGAVIMDVWKHWQVWLPFVLQISGFVLFFLTAPRFPYRFPVVVAVAFLTSKLAALPMNHYLQAHLAAREKDEVA